MKLSINIKGASVGDIFKKNLSIVLWAFLLIIALLTGFVIYKEIRKVTLVNTDNSGITGQIVRVNINQYEALEKRFNNNERFVPTAFQGVESFGVAPVKTNKPAQ